MFAFRGLFILLHCGMQISGHSYLESETIADKRRSWLQSAFNYKEVVTDLGAVEII